MEKYTEYCDLCEKEFDDNKNGISISIKYSIGGWGRSQTLIDSSSFSDICNDCFVLVKAKSENLLEQIRKLKK